MLGVENHLAKLFDAIIPRDSIFQILMDAGDGTVVPARKIVLEDDELAVLREIFSYIEGDLKEYSLPRVKESRSEIFLDADDDDVLEPATDVDRDVADDENDAYPEHIREILSKYED